MTDDAELLAELATVDEVEAYIPTGADHDNSITPPWCELVLSVTRLDDGTLKPAWPLNTRMPLRRHDGELIMQVLWDALHPARPMGAVEQMYMELDRVYDKIMKRVNKGKEPLAAHKYEALGIAKGIALMVNPVEPDVDEVRAVAVERYEARH
jgi:hypothetical protein